ncbi:hypothetical protein SDRG_12131 [Saprolegnia diclina VS20]|uniref:Uncharacterized protein n=1 Tax=Saprolegnia diclina (strain VS20) TaxID=1156394 RepID=T0Q9C1_SAPDV|nr:hypothetical protein SDRG_12131 [Saprolegnia diclina VS20]EQC30070.1 hypothetical protein SDRG_12131 [Saprolegnia diclina VS20]|eukprot:XP_008616413.1 hypothetical protein SDRG_12131 [Saprolegnia diclina VS20]
MELHHILHSSASSEAAWRSGAWTAEEDQYLAALVHAFCNGLLPAVPRNTQLRGYLAIELSCNPMRVSKKLGLGHLLGERLPPRVGRRMYQPNDDAGMARIQTTAQALNDLRQSFIAASTRQSQERVVRSPSSSTTKASRGGSWSWAEQAYTLQLIRCFVQGYVNVPSGTTLRSFLARQLQCCPMRVSKKLGSRSLCGAHLPPRLGRATFVAPQNLSPAQQTAAMRALDKLQRLDDARRSRKE